MSKGILYISNSQAANQLLRSARDDGDILAWDDHLYEGPVPAGRGPEDLVAMRTRFFAEAGFGGDMADAELFSRRLRHLATAMEYRQVTLLFEDGLKDQLQLVQLLDFFAGQRMRAGFLKAYVVADDLGLMPVEEILDCLHDAEPVTGAQLGTGRQAWRAFRSANPRDFERLLRNKATAALPAFRDNIRRLLQQYPWQGNGLNRTQQQILKTVMGGVTRPVNVYLASQDLEAAPFMGVSIFWQYLNEMMSSEPAPLAWDQGQQLPVPQTLEQARRQEGVITITARGKDLLNNRLHWSEMVNIDKWFGGVHVNRDNPWYWSEHDNQMVLGRQGSEGTS